MARSAAGSRTGTGSAAADQRRLVAALACELERAHGVVATLVTHISHVLIAGDCAYKIKKALRLPFVDYSTLARRRRFCDEELRLYRRLAAQLYRDVVAVTGTPDAPGLGGEGRAIEYAVRMRAFAQDALLSECLARGELPPSRIDEFAREGAAFHAGLATGFGIGSLVTPLLMLRFPAPVAVAMMGLPHAIGTGIRWWRLRRHVDIAVLKGFGLASAAGGLAGALAHSRASAGVITSIFAVLLIVSGLAGLTGIIRRLHFHGHTAWVGGLVSGRLPGPGQLGAELGAPADPSEAYSAARPEWYYLFLFQLLKFFEGSNEWIGAIVLPGAVVTLMFLFPIIWR